MKKNVLVTISVLLIFILSSCSVAIKDPPLATSSTVTAGTGSTSTPTSSAMTATPSGSSSSPTATTTTLPEATPTITGTAAGLPNTGSGEFQPQYYSPLQNANYVSKDDTIIVRYGPIVTSQDLANVKFSVQGNQSGAHSGKTILSDDHKTVIFKPDQAFTPGEQVHVKVDSVTFDPQTTYQPLDYTFNVATNSRPDLFASTNVPNATPTPAFPNDLTVPKDIPHYTVTNTLTNTTEGDIFVSPFYWSASTVGSYLLILDGNGNLVYYKPMANSYAGFDFKLLPNGMITYYDQKSASWVVMDNHYQVVDTYQAQNGYSADLHDFTVTPAGYAFIMAYDTEDVDMSKYVQGGNTKAAATGLIIQELDPSKNVIFEWRSWDHIPITDTTSSLTDANIDLIHGNAMSLTNDGELLLSSRNLSEIMKIDLQTGNIIWILGGKANQFKFVNDEGFAFQHDVSQLPNGDITLFDNHGTDQNPSPSRGVEYYVDTVNHTVTRVWQYVNNPPYFTDYMGLTERMKNGNTFMAWGDTVQASGYAFGSMTEVSPDNQVLFSLTFDPPFVSYRASRNIWHGSPLTKPDLAFQQNANGLLLGYSWNGATDVSSWKIYGGSSPQSLNLVDQKAKSGFETQSTLSNLPANECYFQAAAIDQNGNEMARSNVISTNGKTCPAP